ncbi:MAG: hypothetical protein H6706_16645 [Myxococcales bacterium]|nr:hypothetical protein [Myxococcales bacterium]
MRRWWWLGACVAVLGCSEDPAGNPGTSDVEVDAAVVDAAVVDAAPADAAPPDAAVVDAALADAAPVDASPPPDPCAAPFDFLALATPDGEGYVVDGLTGDVDAAQGRCGGTGADAAWRFVAPRAGAWLFLVDDPSPGYDPVLHARSTCADPATELACHDDLPGDDRARVHLRLAAGEATFLFVDAANRRGGFYRLVARTVPALATGDACDPEGLRDACPPGEGCSAVDARCAEDAAPQVDAARVSPLADGTVALTIDGQDGGRDTTTAALQLYAGGRRVVFDPARGTDTWLLRPATPVFGADRFTFRFRGTLVTPLPEADHARVQLRDAAGNRSPWALVPLTPGDVLAPGARCDAAFAACAPGTICRLAGKVRRCQWPAGPTLVRAEVRQTAEVAGVRVQAVDGTAAVRRVEVAVGEDVLEAALTGVALVAGVRAGQASWRGAEVAAPEADVTVIDAAGRRSAPLRVAVAPGPERAEGEGCDPARGLDTCAAGLTCTGACVPLAVECPADWPAPRALADCGADPAWACADDSTDAADRARGSCGGGAGQVIYRFVPPVDGRYHFAVWSGATGADPVLSVRTHCGFPGTTQPELELGCNDDGAGVESRLRLDLAGGVPVFVVVDGYRGSGDGWRGPYTLQVRRVGGD